MEKNHVSQRHVNMRNRILSFILAYNAEHGYSPTYREIGEALNIRSTATVSGYMCQFQSALMKHGDRILTLMNELRPIDNMP